MDVYESNPYLVAESLFNVLSDEVLNHEKSLLDFAGISSEASGVGINDLGSASKSQIDLDERKSQKNVSDKEQNLELV